MTKDRDLSLQGPRREQLEPIVQTRPQASLISKKHCAVRPHLPAELGFRQGQEGQLAADTDPNVWSGRALQVVSPSWR
jgi:hypothetical protein